MSKLLENYHQLVAKLLNVHVADLRLAPLGLPPGLLDPEERSYRPGDLSEQEEQRLTAKVCAVCRGMTAAHWASLNELERLPWLEAAAIASKEDEWLPGATPSDCAKRIGKGIDALKRYIEKGKVRCIKVDSRVWRLHRDDVIAVGGRVD